jgi:HPt (histidine-containing phosphotransfer) domain-containing protein
VAERPSPARAEEAFRQLRQVFVRGLGERARELGQASDPEAVAAALHKLAGAAGVFRFAALAESAREGVRRVRENPGAAAEAAAGVQDLIAAIVAEADTDS